MEQHIRRPDAPLSNVNVLRNSPSEKISRGMESYGVKCTMHYSVIVFSNSI